MKRTGVTAPPLRYRATILALSPLLLLHLLIRAYRDGGWRYLRERLGFSATRPLDDATSPRHATATQRPWVHAASVGEVMTVLPILQTLVERPDIDTVLVTVNTPTGAAVLTQHAPTGIRWRYLPIDWRGATQRFLARENPTSGWIVETEIWPWLYANAQRRRLPLTIINARLSPRTSRHADGVLGPVYHNALSRVTILARSAADASAYQRLGAEPAHTQVVGELKFASALSDNAAPARLIQRPYVLAASTHDDEEIRLAEAWCKQREEGLLIIAPRHPERGESLARVLPDCVRRSNAEQPAPQARLYLADTLGELDAWYAHASGVFVGGSLISRGGHNLLEPARHGRAIVVGPHTSNFRDVVAMLRTAKGLTEVTDAAAVVEFLSRALDGEPKLIQQGQRARICASEGADIADRYLAVLLPA